MFQELNMNKIMSAHAVGALGAVVAMLVLLLQCAEAQQRHVVGGVQGWIVPTSTSLYETWASGQKFSVGDTLFFNFTTGQHNVVEVQKVSYDSCSTDKARNKYTDGPANITLSEAGEHYYICGFPSHCSNGQKLAINVNGSASTPAGSPTTPPATDTTSSPPPSSAPVATTTSAFASFLLLLFSTFMAVMF